MRQPAKTRPEPLYLTASDLAHRWSVSLESLRRWRREGRGPKWVKLGESDNALVRYKLDEIVRYEHESLDKGLLT
jgi:hypothetical protein